MQTMDQAILDWVAQKRIAVADALPRIISKKSRELLGYDADTDLDGGLFELDAIQTAPAG